MQLLGWPKKLLACYNVVVRVFLAGTIQKNSMIWDPILSVLSEIVSLVAKKKSNTITLLRFTQFILEL